MRAILLGTGAPPPNPKRRGPSTLVTLGGSTHFLVDAGSGVGVQMVQAGLRPYDWPAVFITHHHSDHTIDLGHLLITRWIVGQNSARSRSTAPPARGGRWTSCSTTCTGTSRCAAGT